MISRAALNYIKDIDRHRKWNRLYVLLITEKSFVFLNFALGNQKAENKDDAFVTADMFHSGFDESCPLTDFVCRGQTHRLFFVGNNGNKNTAYNGVQLLMRHSCFMRW